MLGNDSVALMGRIGWDPTVSIVAITGKDSTADILSVAHILGAAEVLQKPFAPAELLSAADKVLRTPSPGA